MTNSTPQNNTNVQPTQDMKPMDWAQQGTQSLLGNTSGVTGFQPAMTSRNNAFTGSMRKGY